MTVPVVPTETLRRPGGIGISDIQSLLEPQDKVTADAVPSTESVQEGEKEGEEQKDQNEVKSVEVAILRSSESHSFLLCIKIKSTPFLELFHSQ